MQCYKKENDEWKLFDCTEQEEAECKKFFKKYYIVSSQSNNADTEDSRRVYGEGYCIRDIRDYTVLIEDDVAIGCVYGKFTFLLNGKRSFGGGTYNPYTGFGESWSLNLCEEK
ncbi:MAG: hypothetical protein IJ735_07410 [Clostridia bacterium]|nr:hypothetical protein [Clostridia bacterium]